MVVVGRLKLDTPKEGILAAWATVQDSLRLLHRDVEIYAPFVLGSVLNISWPSLGLPPRGVWLQPSASVPSRSLWRGPL